jgi:glycerophosphoryl diester phosphodiesterase
MKVIAHRGARGYLPENTLSALKKAIEQGADMLEFDVHALHSGEVVIMHDHRLDRTTNAVGYLLDHKFDDLRALDAGEGEKIPTLQEVLDFVNRRVPVDIELKGTDSAKPVAKIITAYLQKGWQPSDFIVSSFNHHELHTFKLLLPQIEIAALQDAIPLNYAAFAEDLHATIVGPGHEFVSKAYVDDAHGRGLKVFVWTINHPDEIKRMKDMGVDGIFTDVPDTSLQTVAALSKI